MPWPKTSRQSRGYGVEWDRLRIQILKRDRYLCQPCEKKGRITSASEVDHVIGKNKGGTDKPVNLQAICTPCHKAKTLEENGVKPKQQTGLDGWYV